MALFFTHQSNDLFITGVDASHGRAWRREPVPTDMSKMMGSRHRAIKKDGEMGKRKEGGEAGGYLWQVVLGPRSAETVHSFHRGRLEKVTCR